MYLDCSHPIPTCPTSVAKWPPKISWKRCLLKKLTAGQEISHKSK